MIAINLPIIAASRGLYILAYYLNYVNVSKREAGGENPYTFSKNEKLYFIAKNAAVILFSMLNLYIALFFAIYSILCAGVYIINIGERDSKDLLKRLGWIFLIACPIGFGVVFSILLNLGVLIPMILATVLFIIWGWKYANLSLEGLFKRYSKRIFKKTPAYLQYAIIFMLLSPAIIALTGLAISSYYFLDGIVSFGIFVFNPILMITINLPIIVGTRFLYILAFYLNFLTSDKRAGLKVYSIRHKLYLLFTNYTILILGFLMFFFTMFFAIYSSLLAGLYFNKWRSNRNKDKAKILEILSYSAAFVSVILINIFYFAPYSMLVMAISGGLSVLFYLNQAQKFKVFTLKEYMTIFRSKFSKAPRVLKYFLIVYVIAEPVIIITGTYTLGNNPQIDTAYIEGESDTTLATDVFFSTLAYDYIAQKPISAPVVLVRTPYDKNLWADLAYVTFFATQGFHVVVQDLRGTFDSETDEKFMPFAKSGPDGVDTIDWILEQEWCNGKIGSAGASALGINQYLYAGMKEAYKDDGTGLQCQSIWVATPDLYLDGLMEGALHHDLVNSWLKTTYPNTWEYQLGLIYDLVNSKDLNSPHYRYTTLNAAPNEWSNVNVAAIHTGGWYDILLRGTIRGYTGYDDKGGDKARGRQAMIIGPWTHGAIYGFFQGELVYPETSVGISLIFDWEAKIFDEALLGKECDLWDENRVAYYLMGDVDDPDVDANYWKFTDDWPLDYDWNEWYFGKDEDGNNVVVDHAKDLDGTHDISYLYDPNDPCLTVGGNNLGSMNSYGPGPFDQRVIESRDDVIVFTSDVLAEPYTVEGDLKVKLYFKSNCTDTDFMVRLSDVYPDGRSMLIIDGARMARLRKDMYSENFLTPGALYAMEIDLIATAYQFNKGHRIRVSITSSNYPRFAINPNTGAPLNVTFTESNIAENTILTGPGLSCIYFPELKE